MFTAALFIIANYGNSQDAPQGICLYSYLHLKLTKTLCFYFREEEGGTGSARRRRGKERWHK
jgi:hypothetical protein